MLYNQNLGVMQKTQIALFPLQIFLLPGESAQLHIFEDRYKQLLEDCEKPGEVFGIPYTLNGYLAGVGCAAEVTKIIKRYPNGAADIEVTSRDMFRVEHFYMRMGEKLYPGGDVTFLHTESSEPVSAALMKALDTHIKNAAPEKFESLTDPHLNVFDAAVLIGMNEEYKVKLVKAKTRERRERILIEQIRFAEALRKQENAVQGEIFLN